MANEFTGKICLLIPYEIDRTTDDASILASVARWLDKQGPDSLISLAVHFADEFKYPSEREPPVPRAEPATFAPRQCVAQAVAIAAGYCVRSTTVMERGKPDAPGYLTISPDDESVGHYPTEAEAWDAAKRHHEDRYITPGEFERAKAAGYDVEPDGFGAGYIARDSEGEEIASPDHGARCNWPTERAAWEACDRHRMFGEG